MFSEIPEQIRELQSRVSNLEGQQKRMSDQLDTILANETAEATELTALQAQLTALETEKAGISLTDPRFAEIEQQQATVKAALDAATASLNPPPATPAPAVA